MVLLVSSVILREGVGFLVVLFKLVLLLFDEDNDVDENEEEEEDKDKDKDEDEGEEEIESEGTIGVMIETMFILLSSLEFGFNCKAS